MQQNFVIFYVLDVFRMATTYYICGICDAGIEKFNSAAADMHGEIAFGLSLDEDAALTR